MDATMVYAEPAREAEHFDGEALRRGPPASVRKLRDTPCVIDAGECGLILNQRGEPAGFTDLLQRVQVDAHILLETIRRAFPFNQDMPGIELSVLHAVALPNPDSHVRCVTYLHDLAVSGTAFEDCIHKAEFTLRIDVRSMPNYGALDANKLEGKLEGMNDETKWEEAVRNSGSYVDFYNSRLVSVGLGGTASDVALSDADARIMDVGSATKYRETDDVRRLMVELYNNPENTEGGEGEGRGESASDKLKALEATSPWVRRVPKIGAALDAYNNLYEHVVVRVDEFVMIPPTLMEIVQQLLQFSEVSSRGYIHLQDFFDAGVPSEARVILRAAMGTLVRHYSNATAGKVSHMAAKSAADAISTMRHNDLRHLPAHPRIASSRAGGRPAAKRANPV